MQKSSNNQKEEKIKENLNGFLPLPNPTNEKINEQFIAWKGTRYMSREEKKIVISEKLSL